MRARRPNPGMEEGHIILRGPRRSQARQLLGRRQRVLVRRGGGAGSRDSTLGSANEGAEVQVPYSSNIAHQARHREGAWVRALQIRLRGSCAPFCRDRRHAIVSENLVGSAPIEVQGLQDGPAHTGRIIMMLLRVRGTTASTLFRLIVKRKDRAVELTRPIIRQVEPRSKILTKLVIQVDTDSKEVPVPCRSKRRDLFIGQSIKEICRTKKDCGQYRVGILMDSPRRSGILSTSQHERQMPTRVRAGARQDGVKFMANIQQGWPAAFKSCLHVVIQIR